MINHCLTLLLIHIVEVNETNDTTNKKYITTEHFKEK